MTVRPLVVSLTIEAANAACPVYPVKPNNPAGAHAAFLADSIVGESMKTLALSTVMIFALAAAAVAQPPPSPPITPAFSPYLNMFNRNNAGINYYGLVRPQFAIQNAIAGLQRQQQSLAESADLTDPTLTRGTGHPVHFNNLSHYYFNDPSQAGGARFGTTGSVAGAARGGVRPAAGAGQLPAGVGAPQIR